ncbi:ankyrin repeat-containing domain protein [Dunaliella salina]|uniref:Ankyrin repeat-containing domain protein n=1 Tax=Dunaliella salina TaxID=3046 RepID=A0ABQ7G9T3_DUNSA|nr:ankyrin repeat-containing domain protein [Dunaliella salina]|eukprot:KAF5831349.1 ankyrin repeat-containing domain protein [Dunaliella salina]
MAPFPGYTSILPGPAMQLPQSSCAPPELSITNSFVICKPISLLPAARQCLGPCSHSGAHLASGLGHAATVELMCALSGPELTTINHEDKYIQQTALVRACSQGHESVVEVLIRQPGIELDKPSCIAQETALHATCRSGHVRVLSLLLSTGQVNVDQLSAWGESPMTLACSEGCLEGVDVLLLAGASVPPLAMLRACAHGHLAVARQLLSVEGMHLDFVDDRGATCLMLGAAGGHGALVEALLDWGMVPAWVEDTEVLAPADLDGNTALHYAGGHGAPEVACSRGGKRWEQSVAAMVGSLIDRCGAAAAHILLHAANAVGETPLAVACRCGREPAARAMLQAVPECVNVPNTQTGCMPMLVASRAGHYELVRLLLQAGGIF